MKSFVSLMDEESQKILSSIGNEHVENIIEEYVSLCQPAKVVVLDDSEKSLKLVRDLAIENGEESPLKMEGHTVHFDGYYDQGRDIENTRVLIPEGIKLSKAIKTMKKEDGLKEITEILDGIMKGKTMYVKFYCLGPVNSKFSIPALQLTDSAYVLHSEDLLYRQGYSQFQNLNGSKSFFHFIHSAGKIENGVSVDVDKRRVFMDLENERVFTVNNQYAGNSVGLKKLALRLAISKANHEDWLCEHMFIMGVHPEGKDRVTYFTGAFPTACGKTSTAMISGQSIVGDDIAYIKPGEDGIAYAVNVEQGIFGIIKDINPEDDPVIQNVLTTPRELIFSNILIKDGSPYWLGMGQELPESGVNYSGEWIKGKQDKDGKEISPAHGNARYTIKINDLENADEKADSPDGVPVRGFIYGGRDSNTSVPVLQTLDWTHGVFMGAVIESETQAGTTEKEGIMKHNPMSNIEFLTVPLSVYIKNHFKFGEDVEKKPLIFATNYFLKDDGKYLNDKLHKKVWILWMEGRVHGEYEAIETPIGYLPKYEDLKKLFQEIFSKDYTKEEYEKQFSIRIAGIQEKLDRMEKVFHEEENIPEEFFIQLNEQRQRLKDLENKFGKQVISPFEI